MHRSLLTLPALATAALLAACSGGGGGAGSAGTGTLKIALTDAPACGYDNVWVTVTKVRVHRSETATDTDGDWSETLVDPSPVVPDVNAEVQAQQRVVDLPGTADDVVVQVAFSNADAVTGDYELSVPEGVARVAPFGQALANGANDVVDVGP